MKSVPYFQAWPKLDSLIKKDPHIEAEIASIVSCMTVKEKVGQMIQPDLRGISAQEMQEYKIGSILNGGGAWPNENKHASAQEWAKKADEFWLATEEMFTERGFRIPFMWATDAVHGHNNVFNATVFPHNIGLGCARDPELIRKIGEITAKEICATGLDWTFAPTVATPRDLHWGRVYEGYSEDPEITYNYAEQMVLGLQGDAETLKGEQHVISNVKHFVGDGGTQVGVDRGVNDYSEDLLRNIHAMGYLSGLNAGAQVVMSSFNSWVNNKNYDLEAIDVEEKPEVEYNYKIHGSKYLLTDVLKEQMGFDGLIVTDWHGHAEVSKCSDADATYAINAGNDILMVPVHKDWLAVYATTLKDIESGKIPMARIDDAVTRILRVKMRAGLWDKPMPSQRKLGGDNSQLGAMAHREVAREAVRKSMVLLKNNHQLLPLDSTQPILLTGSAAHNLQKQAGGWNLTWQGDENSSEDFPQATTVKQALEQVMGSDNIIYTPELEDLTQKIQPPTVKVALVVIGEDSYAEMMGDIKGWQSLEFARLKRAYNDDVQKIYQLKELGYQVITLFFSGRPLYMNNEINHSDAFVAAFLPGSEGEGIIDVLVGDENGEARYDFTGRLSFSWPNKVSSARVHRKVPHIPNYSVPENEQDPEGEHAPLFAYGYGLSYLQQNQEKYGIMPALISDLNNIPLDNEIDNSPSEILDIYGVRSVIGDYQLKTSDELISRNNPMHIEGLDTRPYNYQQQQDAMRLSFTGKMRSIYIETTAKDSEDLSYYAEKSLHVEIFAEQIGATGISVSIERSNRVQIKEQITLGQWSKVSVPLDEFSVDLNAVRKLFVLQAETGCEFVVANISIG